MKKLLAFLSMAFVAMALVACGGSADLVAKTAQESFDQMLRLLPVPAAKDSAAAFVISAPDNSVKVLIGTQIGRGADYDLAMVFPALPFIAAGLDVDKLPEKMQLSADQQEIIIAAQLPKKAASNPITSPQSALAAIVEIARPLIGYHAALDHFGITIGDGNLLEWAKDYKTNDKDLVFVLSPIPFINAGVEVKNVQGWVFGKVIVDDEYGKPVEVEKLLKPFNLR